MKSNQNWGKITITLHIAPETNVFYIGPGNLTKQIVAANNCMGYTVGWDRNYIGLLPLGDPVVPVMRVSSDFIFMSVCLICLDFCLVVKNGIA